MSLGAIRVNRVKDGDNPKVGDPLGEAIRHLKAGAAIYINPEGERNMGALRKDLLLPFHAGAVKMAAATGAPLVPTVIVGRFRPFKHGLKWIIGKPYYVRADADPAKETTKLRNTMYHMLKDNGEEL
jgi:1-acyl-sn-glycerol-3-phosphate acyltransferase